MNAKYLTLNYGCKRQIVKSIIKIVPNIVISIFFGYLIVKSIHKCDITWLMISSKKYYSIGIFEFVKEKK